MKQMICLLVVVSLISCRKNCGDPGPPPPVIFHVVDQTHIIDYKKANLYWFEDGILYSENEQGSGYKSFSVIYPTLPGTNPAVVDSTRPMLRSLRMMAIANRVDTTTFYLDYGNGQMDTLKANVLRENIEEDHCITTHFELTGVYKGSPLVRDTFDQGPFPVFLLKRN